MRYRQLGNSGLTVSVVGLGCNNFGFRISEQQSAEVLGAALDAGVTFLDTSNHSAVQGRVLSAEEHGVAETIIGKVMKGRRNDVVIATKFGNEVNDGPEVARASRRYVRRAVEDSLRRLKTDYIDLYQLHRRDPRTPIEETLAVLDDLVREGKILYIGSTNLTGWRIADADWRARSSGTARFISAQNRYNLLEREAEAEIIPACEALGIGFLPFYPLASGLLTGKVMRAAAGAEGTRLAGREFGEAVHDRIDAIREYAAAHSLSLLQVAIGALVARPAVSSVIAGATRPEQVRANAEAGDWNPDREQVDALEAVLGPHHEHHQLVAPPLVRWT